MAFSTKLGRVVVPPRSRTAQRLDRLRPLDVPMAYAALGGVDVEQMLVFPDCNQIAVSFVTAHGTATLVMKKEMAANLHRSLEGLVRPKQHSNGSRGI
jgi:hypothetical protein